MKFMPAGLVLAVMMLAAPAGAADEGAEAEADIIETIRAFNNPDAINDIDAHFDHYADGATVYFYGTRKDVVEYRAEWTTIVALGAFVERNDISEIRVTLLPGGDAAVASYFIESRLRLPNGDLSSSTAFQSDVWQRVDGTWKVINVHYSDVPAEPGGE